MATVDALFRSLSTAPARSVQIVRRAVLEGMPLTELAQRYGISEAAAHELVERSLADAGLAGQRDALAAHRDVLRSKLDEAADAWAKSPDRVRDERLRQLAIVVVLALTAFFYWREANKPLPPSRPRPMYPATTP